jgi:hypothetical protein
MKKIAIALIITFLTTTANAAVFWTVKATKGILTTSAGTVAINIGDYSPTGPNPAGTEWEDCKNNWIYMHKTADGTAIDDKYVDRMLSVALAAYKTDSKIRVQIERDDTGYCYTAQIYDEGS